MFSFIHPVACSVIFFSTNSGLGTVLGTGQRSVWGWRNQTEILLSPFRRIDHKHSKLKGYVASQVGKHPRREREVHVCVLGRDIDRMIQKGLTEKLMFERRSKVRGERANSEDTW